MKQYVLGSALLALVSSACVQSVPITYYHLPLFELQESKQKKQAFDVQVSVADYLDREALLTRRSAVSFDVNDAALWGSSLQEQIELLVKRRLRAEYQLDAYGRIDGISRNLHIAVDQADVDQAGGAQVQMRWWHRRDREHTERCETQSASLGIDARVEALSAALHECVGKIISKIP